MDSGPKRTSDGPEAERANEGSAHDPVDLARAALLGARRIGRPLAGRRRRRGAATENGERRGGYSGPAPDAVDPQLLGDVLADYVQERGWDRPLAEARVFADWATLVGGDVAAHCAPVSLTGGELKVAAESTAWATQLRLLSATLLARLAAELGPEVVARISISGPTGPSWKHGGFSVRGARGPRDTYG